jgi:phosphoribosylformylglycinamidine cyclo-ligase
MYEVFNMGTRMEVYCDPSFAERIMETARNFGVEARIIGRVEPADKKELHIVLPSETLVY